MKFTVAAVGDIVHPPLLLSLPASLSSCEQSDGAESADWILLFLGPQVNAVTHCEFMSTHCLCKPFPLISSPESVSFLLRVLQYCSTVGVLYSSSV